MDITPTDVVVIGGGQAGQAVGYYLRRTGHAFVILDAEDRPGGAWRHSWDSLCLFSPARWSSLPGWIMPGGVDQYPERDDVIDYLAHYEARYRLPVRRPVCVEAVRRADGALLVETDAGVWRAQAVVSATGTWRHPYIPAYPGRDTFQGIQIHSADYRSPLPFLGQRVLVIGGGNSGAQILAEVSLVADTTWVTKRPPIFLPDDVDGRVLFERATQRYLARKNRHSGAHAATNQSLGDIVMVPPVREARDRGALRSVRPFLRFTPGGVVWSDGTEAPVDAVIWATGFRPVLEHLRPLGVLDSSGQVKLAGTRAVREPRLWLVGYGEWTGYASATLIGVGRSARATVTKLDEALTDAYALRQADGG